MKTRFIQCLLAVIGFSVAVAVAVPEEPKQAELKVSVLRASTERDGVVIRFENRSQTPLRLLRPIDGSEWSWHMPIYDLSITDPSGKAVPHGIRCKFSGLYSGMKWPDDYRIQILPGDAYETTIGLCRELPASGRYTVSLKYAYDPASKTVRQFPVIKYPDDLWVGSSASDSVTLEFTRP